MAQMNWELSDLLPRIPEEFARLISTARDLHRLSDMSPEERETLRAWVLMTSDPPLNGVSHLTGHEYPYKLYNLHHQGESGYGERIRRWSHLLKYLDLAGVV